jgi:hypothetical protein
MKADARLAGAADGRRSFMAAGAAALATALPAGAPGIGMLKSHSVVGERVASAMKSGLLIVACEHTMAAQKLSKADMLPGIGYVPAGVVELMRKQQQGYASIRP